MQNRETDWSVAGVGLTVDEKGWEVHSSDRLGLDQAQKGPIHLNFGLAQPTGLPMTLNCLNISSLF